MGPSLSALIVSFLIHFIDWRTDIAHARDLCFFLCGPVAVQRACPWSVRSLVRTRGCATRMPEVCPVFVCRPVAVQRACPRSGILLTCVLLFESFGLTMCPLILILISLYCFHHMVRLFAADQEITCPIHGDLL